jgi:hypothetical protein
MIQTEKIKKTAKKPYFGKEVQDNIVLYNSLPDSEKNKKDLIFKTEIYPAFMKLSENIINTWKFKLHDLTFSDLQHELVYELYTKLSGYNPESGKAYSYFTIIARNACIRRSEIITEKIKSSTEVEAIDDSRDLIGETSLTEYQETLREFIQMWCAWCEDNLDKLFKSSRDQKIADSVIELLKNSSNFDIYNKKLIYVLIRERSGVDTQNITKVVKILKEYFFDMFKEYQNKGFVDTDRYLY